MYFFISLFSFAFANPVKCSNLRPNRDNDRPDLILLEEARAAQNAALAAQVARDTASALQSIGSAITPRMLNDLMELNVMQCPQMYSACVAFEPGMFPDVIDEPVDVNSSLFSLAHGVPSASASMQTTGGTAFRHACEFTLAKPGEGR